MYNENVNNVKWTRAFQIEIFEKSLNKLQMKQINKNIETFFTYLIEKFISYMIKDFFLFFRMASLFKIYESVQLKRNKRFVYLRKILLQLYLSIDNFKY